MLILRAFGAVPSSFTEPVTEPAVAASTGVVAGAPVGAGALSDDSSFLPQLASRVASNAADTTAKPNRAFMACTFLLFTDSFPSARPSGLDGWWSLLTAAARGACRVSAAKQ